MGLKFFVEISSSKKSTWGFENFVVDQATASDGVTPKDSASCNADFALTVLCPERRSEVWAGLSPRDLAKDRSEYLGFLDRRSENSLLRYSRQGSFTRKKSQGKISRNHQLESQLFFANEIECTLSRRRQKNDDSQMDQRQQR